AVSSPFQQGGGQIQPSGTVSFATRTVNAVSPELEAFRKLAPFLQGVLVNTETSTFVSKCAEKSLISHNVSGSVNDLARKAQTPGQLDMAKSLVRRLHQKIKGSENPRALCGRIADEFQNAGQNSSLCEFIRDLAKENSVAVEFGRSSEKIANCIQHSSSRVADYLFSVGIITDAERKEASDPGYNLRVRDAGEVMEALEETISNNPAALNHLRGCMGEICGGPLEAMSLRDDFFKV
ncbi:hypothetical protein M3P05_20635, partial [Sansalvadorimonas sp. 2012CJ34-2]